MAHEPAVDIWASLDQALDPAALLRFLDALNALPAYQDYKRRGMLLLQPRPGQRLLEVGCGPGDDARTLAEWVGGQGRVVGVDNSQAMLDAARQRAAGTGLPVEFRLGDAQRLDFPTASFDGCRSDRVLLHVAAPAAAVAEMARVVRPGGRVVVSEFDWGSSVVDASDRPCTRRILDAHCDREVRNGWAGRQALGYMRAAGLADCTAHVDTLVFTAYDGRREAWRQRAEAAVQAGAVSAAAVRQWLAELEVRGQAGQFFEAVMMVTVCGQKPSDSSRPSARPPGNMLA